MAKPSIWRRMGGVFRPSTLEPNPDARAAWWDDNTGAWDHHDPKLSAFLDQQTPQLRRAARTDADIMALYGSVFAAIRRRQSAVIKPEIVLFRKGRAGNEPEVIEEHEALDALHRINESLTFSQGFGLIEQHKCTAGSAYWIKRRAGGRQGGRTVEFEIWDPFQTRIIPDPRKPWVPLEFRRRIPMKAEEEVVAAEDVLFMRHVIDPRNLLNGLSPIGAVRMTVDTSMEALRYNQKLFDNDASPAIVYSMPDASQAEVERVEQEMERKFRGTDNKHKGLITTGELTEVSRALSQKDMEFMEQQRWTKAEVATVFEI
ncbi:MAG: phage portal protein, partial [Chloroflexi bacterium]|nr:phage portal protein [Chloroflexota bacterium]